MVKAEKISEGVEKSDAPCYNGDAPRGAEGNMEFVSFDGKKIFVHEWTDVKEPRGIVQIVHGMAEHAGRYDGFARFLNEKGFLVVADDHRGHGKTDPDTLGYSSGNMFADTVRDEAELVKHYRAEYPDLKYVLFGFSYGSFLTQSFLGKYSDLIDGAIVAGSNHKKDFEVYLGSVVSHLRGQKRPAKLIEKLSFGAYSKQFEDRQWLSVDEENNSAYAADPLCGFTCSNRFYRDFFKGLKGLYTKKYAAGIGKDLPVLLISGANDPVGEQGKGVKRLHRYYTEKAGMKDVSIVLFENSRHEFLNEKEGRDRKWGEPLRFLERI